MIASLHNLAIIIEKGTLIRQAPVEDLLSQAFHISGKSVLVREFIRDRKILSFQSLKDFATAVIEGDLKTEPRVPGLAFSSLTIQKLFIHLTAGKGDEGQQK